MPSHGSRVRVESRLALRTALELLQPFARAEGCCTAKPGPRPTCTVAIFFLYRRTDCTCEPANVLDCNVQLSNGECAGSRLLWRSCNEVLAQRLSASRNAVHDDINVLIRRGGPNVSAATPLPNDDRVKSRWGLPTTWNCGLLSGSSEAQPLASPGSQR
jgi:hypothetical protein